MKYQCSKLQPGRTLPQPILQIYIQSRKYGCVELRIFSLLSCSEKIVRLSSLSEIGSFHLGATARAISALEPVAAGNAHIVNTATAAAAKHTATKAAATHSPHTTHLQPAHIVAYAQKYSDYCHQRYWKGQKE